MCHNSTILDNCLVWIIALLNQFSIVWPLIPWAPLFTRSQVLSFVSSELESERVGVLAGDTSDLHISSPMAGKQEWEETTQQAVIGQTGYTS